MAASSSRYILAQTGQPHSATQSNAKPLKEKAKKHVHFEPDSDSDSSDQEEWNKRKKRSNLDKDSGSDSSDEEEWNAPKNKESKAEHKDYPLDILENKQDNNKFSTNKVENSSKKSKCTDNFCLAGSTLTAGLQGCLIILDILIWLTQIRDKNAELNPFYLLLAIPGGLTLAGFTYQGLRAHNHGHLSSTLNTSLTTIKEAHKQSLKMIKFSKTFHQHFKELKKHALLREAQIFPTSKSAILEKKSPMVAKSPAYSPLPSNKEIDKCELKTCGFGFTSALVSFLSHISTIYVAREAAQDYFDLNEDSIFPWEILVIIAVFLFNLYVFRDIQKGIQRYAKLDEDVIHLNKKVNTLDVRVKKNEETKIQQHLEKLIVNSETLSIEIDRMLPPHLQREFKYTALDSQEFEMPKELMHFFKHSFYYISRQIDIASAVLGAISTYYKIYRYFDLDNQKLALSLNIFLFALGLFGTFSTFKNILRGSNFGIFRFEFEKYIKDLIDLYYTTTKDTLKKSEKLDRRTIRYTELLILRQNNIKLFLDKNLTSPKNLTQFVEDDKPKNSDGDLIKLSLS